jgi:phage tail-like protein
MRAMLGRRVSDRRRWVLGVTVLSLALLGTRPVEAQPREGQPRYSFTVEIEGTAAGMFREVTGLSVETEVVEYRDGSTNDIRKLPGRTLWPNIVLKRGFTGNTELYDWAMTYLRTGTVVRRSGSIIMYDQSGNQVTRWNFENAWPVKWDGPTLDASGTEVAIETLVLAHDGLSLSDDDR